MKYFSAITKQVLRFVSAFLLISTLVNAARQPIVSGDSNEWGTILNAYLNISLDVNGTLKNQTFNVTGSNVFLTETANIVGLGTPTPSAKLHIQDSSAPGAFIITNLSGITLFYVNGSSGRIGIGNTTNPADTLTIIGSVSVFGSLNATFINATRIFMGSNLVQTESPAWKLSNFTAAYDNRADRFGIANYSAEYASTGYKLSNFTSNYASEYASTGYKKGNLSSDLAAGTASTILTTTLTSDNIIVNKNLYIIGNISNTNIANLNINGSMHPALDAFFDVGNGTFRWRNANFSGTLQAATVSGTFVGDGTSITGVQQESPAYKSANFTSHYDSRADRYSAQNATNDLQNSTINRSIDISTYNKSIDLSSYNRSVDLSTYNKSVDLGGYLSPASNASSALWNTSFADLPTFNLYPREQNTSLLLGFVNTSKNWTDTLVVIGSVSVYGSLNATFINATEILVGGARVNRSISLALYNQSISLANYNQSVDLTLYNRSVQLNEYILFTNRSWVLEMLGNTTINRSISLALYNQSVSLALYNQSVSLTLYNKSVDLSAYNKSVSLTKYLLNLTDVVFNNLYANFFINATTINSSNITATNITATRFTGKLDCGMIDGGSDSDYCADATGAGGGGAPTTSEYILGNIDDTLTNAVAFRRSAIMYEEFIGDAIADYRISVLGTPTASVGTVEPRFWGVVNAVAAATIALDGGVSLGSYTATTTAGYNATSFRRFEGMVKLTAITGQHTRIGMLSSGTTQDALTVNNGFFFYYNSTNGGAMWQARTCMAGICNISNLTNVQANTNWFNFSIVPSYNGNPSNSGNNVSFYFNGTLVANHTLVGKLPNLVPWIGVWTETTDATADTTRVDYLMAIYNRHWR